MDQNKFPSDEQERFLVRMPDGMRDRIANAAKAAGRSMNAEIVARLAASFETAPNGDNEDLMRRISFLEGQVSGSQFTAQWIASESNEAISRLHQFANAVREHSAALEEVVSETLDELESWAEVDEAVPVDKVGQLADEVRHRYYQLEYDGRELKAPDLRKLKATGPEDGTPPVSASMQPSPAERTEYQEMLPILTADEPEPKAVAESPATAPKSRFRLGRGKTPKA